MNKSPENSGRFIVGVTGNGGDPGVGNCIANWPGQRRDVLAVGAYLSNTDLIDPDTAPISTYSARGGMDLTLWDGSVRADAVAIADLVAPGERGYGYSGLNGYSGQQSGTSFAAPAVAGGAGLLRQQMNSIGWPGNDARILLVNLLLFGDGFAFDRGTAWPNRFDPRSGAGRTHFAFPSASYLTAPWGWGYHALYIGPNEERCFPVGDAGPESASVTQWKASMTWVEDNYTTASDIVLTVHDTCAPGNPTVFSDVSFDLRKRVELFSGSIAGRCLSYCAKTFTNSMPAGAARLVYLADYYHSGDPADH